MPVQVQLRAAGLTTFSNNLELRPGALLTADNVVIDQPNVIEQRRGLSEYGTQFDSLTDRAKQLLVYKGRILRHVNSTLQFDSNGSGDFLSFSGSYTETESGLRLKSVEANGNFYFTTDAGIKKISAQSASDLSTSAGYITQAGGPKSLDLSAQLSTTAGAGFLPPDSKVAYRVLWGTKDSNSNLILGTPSERVVISYPAMTTFSSDINNLLLNLDATCGNLLTDGNYFSSLKLNETSTAIDAYNNLKTLATKLDTDIRISDAVSPATAIISTTGSAANLALIFSSPVTGYLTGGDAVALGNFPSPIDGLNNSSSGTPSWTILSVVGATAYLSVSASSTATVTSLPGATVNSYNFRKIQAPSSTPSSPATYAEDLANREYFNSIVNQIHASPTSWIRNSSSVGHTATDGSEVKLEFSVPSEITASNYNNYFYQVYRTEISTSEGLPGGLADVNPGDEMALVNEDNPSSDQVTARYVQVIDNTPDSFRGLNLYTNQISGEGINQANSRPPVAKDIALFKNCVFYSNTRGYQTKNLTLLGTNSLVTSLTSPTAVVVASGTATLKFSASLTGVAVGDVITLNSFTGASQEINGAYTLTSVTGASASFSTTLGNFSDSISGDMGAVIKSEYITITQGIASERYSFVPASLEKSQIIFNSASTLPGSGTAGYFVISAGGNSSKFAPYYLKGTAVAPAASAGITLLPISLNGSETAAQVAQKTIDSLSSNYAFSSVNTTYSGATGVVQVVDPGFTDNTVDVSTGFTFATLNNGAGELPASGFVAYVSSGTPGQNIEDVAKSLIKTINQKTSGAFSAVYTSSENSTPGKFTVSERSLSSTTFSLTASTATVGLLFDPTLPTSGTSVVSDNSVQPNGLYYSKTNQPEAVPALNYVNVGPKDKPISRILALRDSLFILKTDGIYRVSGDSPSNFSVFLFDTSARILAPDSAVVLNNQIYMWSDQGIVTVSDIGVSIVSRDIEDQLNRLVNFSAYKTATFGVSYDLDRAYLLWTVSKQADTVATQCFRFNFLTQSWTRWLLSKTCGIVSNDDNKLYTGSATRPFIDKERKNLDRTDFCDREFTTNISNSSVNGTRVVLNSLSDVEIYDVLGQTQYLTISDFNLLLKKIDLDPASSLTNDYYSSLGASSGANIRDKIISLAGKLDSDLAVSTFSNLPAVTAASNSSPSTLQTAYNSITNSLNSSTAVSFDNYPSVTGTVLFESLIVDSKLNEVAVTTAIDLPLIVGPATVFKHYDTIVEYAPQTFGNPATLKHVREATYLFKTDNFKGAKFEYATDLSPGFDTIDYSNTEDGTFGNYTFGEDYYGGGGQSIPLRVLIPQQKQRCTFIRARFHHTNARELYQLYGLTMTVEENAVAARGYR